MKTYKDDFQAIGTRERDLERLIGNFINRLVCITNNSVLMESGVIRRDFNQ